MIRERKKFIRKQIKLLKDSFSIENRLKRSELICMELEKLPEFIEARIVLIYWSMDDEVHTHSFIQKWHQSKIILLPSVNGDDMDLKIYAGLKSMKKGEQFGIEEPIGEVFIDYDRIDVAIIPGIAFDERNYRMGRGRGYYDKFLSGYIGRKIGICFDFQVLDEVPIEKHDVVMDRVVYK